MTIVDCCLFSAETDLLTLRYLTLREVVDHFCVVACTFTHQGQPADRDMIRDAFDAACKAAAPPSASLTWVEPDLNMYAHGRTFVRPPDERGPAGSPWYGKVEAQHRDGCRDAAAAWTTDGDVLVLVSDVDEIPDPDLVGMVAELLTDEGQPRWWTFEQRMHSTALNLLHPHQPWFGSCASRLRDCEPQAMRDARTTIGTDEETIGRIADGGWHISWVGTDAERARKLETFSHAEHRFWPHVDGRFQHRHINGEELRLLSMAEVEALSWPAPIVSGEFQVPSEWWV